MQIGRCQKPEMTMNQSVIFRIVNEAQRIFAKGSQPVHPLLYQHFLLGALVIFTELLTEGEWLEQHDMYCLRRLDMGELSPDHQDWARCEQNFYSTALRDKPQSQRLHPWLYNKLRMSVHVYTTIGLLLLGYGVWLTFQSEMVLAALQDFRGPVPSWDKKTRRVKRRAMEELLRHNRSLGLYAADVAVTLYFTVVDTILMACMLMNFDPWAIMQHLGERDILNPDDVTVTSFPALTWCDVSRDTGRFEGTYNYNCEVAANNTYVLLVVFLAIALAATLLKTLVTLFHYMLVVCVPSWRREVLGTPVPLPTGRTVDICHLRHYTTLRGYRAALREEVKKRLGKNVFKV